MKKLQFSVIIPLYNGANYILNTLESVICQTYKDYEIILINDGSPDNVGDVVKTYIKQQNDTNFVYIEQENKGLGGARNSGIRKATGDIIAILDQDDIWYPNKLERMNKILIENENIDIVCHLQYLCENNTKKRIYDTGVQTKDLFRFLLFRGNVLSTSATCFRKNIVGSIGNFSEDIKNLHFTEDYEFWLRASLNGYSFYFEKGIYGEYSSHSSNYSSSSAEKLIFMNKSERYVINLYYNNPHRQRKIYDWYLIRQRYADSYYILSYRTLLITKNIKYFLKYYFFSILTNPLYIIFIPLRIIRKFIKLILRLN